MHAPSSAERDEDEPSDQESHRRRHKRRKLDSDPLNATPEIKYGYKGQVVPGRLRMFIYGCDGGSYSYPEGVYASPCVYDAENVLRNDQSVYCTGKDKCDIILAHDTFIPFCLTKLVIKTPKSGFTAPYVFLTRAYMLC
jgi:hypothetical protein